MNDRCPRFLFKYFGHPLWPEERPLENPAFKLLETLTLKVNQPSEFNDPFEFSPVFDEPVARSEVRARLASVLSADAQKRRLPSKFAEDLADVVLSLKQSMMKPTTAPFHLAELFDFVEGVLAWVKDRRGRYLWVNRAFLIKYALDHPGADGLVSAEKILGKTDYDLSPAFMADQFRHDDEQVLSGHRIINRIERVGEFEGMTAWNITNKIPVFDAKGAIIGTAGITRTLSTGGLPGGTVSGFVPALAYMRDHYQRVITNQQLASISKMSLRAFERQFLAGFHLTPQKYLRKLRLRIASRALIYTNEALSEVALSCGFADQSHFTREFRRQFGRTPREYREHYKLSAGVPVTKTAARKQ